MNESLLEPPDGAARGANDSPSEVYGASLFSLAAAGAENPLVPLQGVEDDIIETPGVESREATEVSRPEPIEGFLLGAGLIGTLAASIPVLVLFTMFMQAPDVALWETPPLSWVAATLAAAAAVLFVAGVVYALFAHLRQWFAYLRRRSPGAR